MTVYASMLRGVNVAGKRMLKMSELAELYVSLGFDSVQTYLQSGNVIFSSNKGASLGLEEKVERGLKERFGFDAKVFIRTPGELGRVIRENPFVKKERTRLYVTFLHSKPSHVPLDKINAARMGGEEFSVSGREVFLFLPNGSGKTKLSNAFFEKVLDVPATTRNWNTVTSLAELAGHASG
ncbi:MAG TPA: DUF1697 domain-containing protein [Candidatus Dormibacteraeota bacterium]|nr:DUF1697 domain-containing protein [Candidatus Dormibacteraeota bacterium]